MNRAYTVLHLITGLDTGGAELALARLVEDGNGPQIKQLNHS